MRWVFFPIVFCVLTASVHADELAINFAVRGFRNYSYTHPLRVRGLWLLFSSFVMAGLLWGSEAVSSWKRE